MHAVSPAGSSGRNRFIHVNTQAPFGGELIVASWNVEGFSDVKLWQLIASMRRNNVSILCVQETHVTRSPYYTVDGFLVILSGANSGDRELAGVGFIVAPWTASSMV